MGLEVSTYISDLVISNPASGDKKKFGDDHLRNIKAALRNTFPNADRPFRLPSVTGSNGDLVLTADYENILFFANSSIGPITITLPAGLTTLGWQVRILKSSGDVNPVYVVPPSGTINGFAKIRLNVPYEENIFSWGGTAFYRSNTLQVAGALLPFGGTVAPVGFGFPIGQSILRADYPELFGAWGTSWGAADGTHFNVPDLRDKFIVGAGSTYALGNTGGEATHALLTTEMPVHAHTITQNPHDHAVTVTGGTTGQLQIGNDTAAGTSPAGTGAAIAVDVTPANADITINNAGGGLAHENRPPYLGLPYIFRLC